MVLFALVLSRGPLGFAHPPSAIGLSFDNRAKNLSVAVVHPVSNPRSHFIDKVLVKNNEEIAKEETLTGQGSNRAHEMTVNLPDVQSGDIISVTASCNISRRLTKKIVVP